MCFSLVSRFVHCLVWVSLTISFSTLTVGASEGEVSGQTVTAQFRGGPAHTGVYATHAPAHLRLRWKFQAKEAIVASPTVADGVVYIGSWDNFLYALDAETGRERWRFDAHGNVNSSCAVAGGKVFFVSLDGRIYAANTNTGKQLWSFSTQGERRHTGAGMDYAAPTTEMMPDPWDFFLSSPCVEDETVYFGSGDGSIYALDANTGREHWHFTTQGVVHASPAVKDGVLYIGSFDSFFYALDAKTGALKWKFKTGSDDHAHLMTGIPGSAAVANETVYFGSRDGYFYALDAETGALRWKYAADGSWVIASPAIWNGKVVFTTSDSLKLVVLDAATGAIQYTMPNKIYSFSSPAIVGDRAWFGTFDGKLHTVDLSRAQYTEEFTVPRDPKVVEEVLDANGKLNPAIWKGDTLDDVIVALRVKVFALGSILSSPVVASGTIYMSSVDGCVYALGD
ncbi:MAG TPA: PQQ-binding-like beta-propeller repeat protein [Opitutaceae bacterium]